MANDRKRMITGLVAAGLAILFVYLFFDRAVIYLASRAYGLTVSYKDIRKAPSGQLAFDNLKVVYNKLDVGLFAAAAAIKPAWLNSFLGKTRLDFNLHNVRFSKGASVDGARYDTLTDLVFTPFSNYWKYDEITGSVEVKDNVLIVKDLKASGKDIRLSLNGELRPDNTLAFDIVIYFSSDISRRVPEALTKVILRDEDKDWKSLSVKLTGDFRAPAIQLTGKLFRLNIKMVEVA